MSLFESQGNAKKKKSTSTRGMFSPLEGNEFSQRLKSKFASDDEDDEISVKSERLTSVLFIDKQSGSGCHGNSSGNGNSDGKGTTGRVSKYSQKKSPSVERDNKHSSRLKHPLTITGGEAKDPKKELKKISDVSSMLDPHSVKKALQKRVHVDHTLSSSDDEEFHVSGFNDEDMEKPKFLYSAEAANIPYILSQHGDTPVVQVPGVLNRYLRDYQRDGIQFLYEHYSNNTGAILGDDMGLGKTVQVIGFLSALLGKQGNRVDVMRQKPRFIRKMSDTASVRNDSPTKGPFLIIGPGCVLYNWLDEFETWGYFSVRKYHGTDKAECIKDLRKGKTEIVVTTFETYREHMEVLNTIDWDAVIVDEVHKIKEMKAKTTQALRSINTMRRFGLTGTALQNNLLEFWSILDWARPGCLGSQNDFVQLYVRPIESGQRHDANKRELATARKQKEKLASIRKSMMIRRVKSLISDQLPKKDDNVVFCRLSQLQISMYKTILDQPGMDLVLHMDDPCHCDSGEPQSKCCKKKSPDGQSIKSLMFTFMHLLLKVSNHVALLIPNSKTSSKQQKTSRKICEDTLKDHPEFMEQTRDAAFRTLSDPKYCGKMKILQGLLKVFYKEHSKTLVFSYSTRVLDIIEQYLMSTGYEYRRIDGTVSSKKRMDIVREYNHDPNIFICLISTKAGGLGLNLTGANKVVIFDPNWNPTHDLQAQDRAYRIGQRRNVMVYRLVSSGSIEENMYLRQIYKQQLLNVTVEDENAKRYFYAVQGNPQQKGELFGIKNMFILRTGEACITRDIIKRNEIVESAIEGFNTAKYVSPVVRIEDDDDIDDYLPDTTTTTDGDDDDDNDGDNNDDYFKEFFSSDDDSVNRKEDEPKALPKERKHRHAEVMPILSDHDSDIEMKQEQSRSNVKRDKKVTFKSGKVQPEQSKTGKGPMKRKVQSDDDQYDQTLAGTFTDVSDVFDNCGVIHIHKNVKVVGGSRAEDHMSKCAMSDVYELHQNSQDLAVQCEPMPEPSDEDDEVEDESEHIIEDYNKVRSELIGQTKFLVGQTPKAFKMKHLKELSKFHSDGSLLDFAEFVLNSSLENRIHLLNSFYSNKYPELKDIHKLTVAKTTKSHSKVDKKKTLQIKNKRSSRKVKSKSQRPVKGPISFMEDVEPDSESISQHSDKSVNLSVEEGDVESMEIGRKTSCKKRMPTRTRKPYKLLTDERVEGMNKSGDRHVESLFKTLDKEPKTSYESHTKIDGESMEASGYAAEDLLCELGRKSSVSKDDNKSSKFGAKNEDKFTSKDTTTGSDVLSIQDDIFDETNATRKRKPAPVKNSPFKSPKKRSKLDTTKNKTGKSDIFKTADKTDIFKALDDIFSDDPVESKAENKKDKNSRDSKPTNDFKEHEKATEDVNDIGVDLDISTFKDVNDLDYFDNPKLWKKKRKKPREECGTAADRMIADSDADYLELFTSGKMKKKTREKSSVSDSASIAEFNGSESLFS
ncbi:DNA excision repair protein ERCC-6-like 2 [Mactra antiquata]